MNERGVLPFLTADIPPVPGLIKTDPEDFRVEEVPLYEPSGEGTHTYLLIEKRGIPTMEATRRIAKAIGVHPRQIGSAGLKDARAVTHQWLSVEHVDPAVVEDLELPNVRVVDVARHGNKLRIGHLLGNRFAIRLHEADPGRLDDVERVFEVLQRRGLPNHFGPQRFGMRGDTWQVGRATLLQDWDACIRVLVGSPRDDDPPAVARARDHYETGRYAEAAEAWPYAFHMERRICRTLERTSGDAERAYRAIDKPLRRFYVSAYQSWLFNRVVAERMDRIDRLLPGDLAQKHPRGGVFLVENAEVEQPRCDALEISPTGPMFGYKMKQAEGPVAEMEDAVLAEDGLTLESFRAKGAHRIKGGRRPLRVPLTEVGIDADRDDRGDFIELRFFLPAGSYALNVVREICKRDMSGPDDEVVDGD